MNLFFEDVEIKNNSAEVEAVNEDIVVEDVTGLISVALESEMAWNNLQVATMHEEFSAIYNEDEEQAGAARTNYFKQAITTLQAIWKRVVAFVQQLVSRLQAQFSNGARIMEKNKAKLNGYQGTAKATVFDWNVKGMGQLASQFPPGIGGVLKKQITAAGSDSKERSADELAKALGYSSASKIDGEIAAKARKASRTEVQVTQALVGEAEGDIRTAKAVLNSINNLGKEAKDLVSAGLTAAKAGLKAAEKNDSAAAKKAKAEINTAKNAQTVINKIINVFVKLEVERYADSMRVISAAASSGKASNKDNKQASKQARSNEKNAATSGKKGKSSGAEVAVAEDLDDIFDLKLEDDEIEGEIELEDIELEDIELEDIEIDLEDIQIGDEQ
jgi:hypothetical protein